MRPGTAKRLDAIIDAALRGQLDDAHARRLHDLGPEAVALAMLAASQRIAELQGQSHGQQPSPSTPSGMVPIYTKPNTHERRKNPGARQGHAGHRRKTPNEVYSRLRPANGLPRIEPRKRWPRSSPCTRPTTLVAGQPGAQFTLQVAFQDGKRHLPIVSLKRAA